MCEFEVVPGWFAGKHLDTSQKIDSCLDGKLSLAINTYIYIYIFNLYIILLA